MRIRENIFAGFQGPLKPENPYFNPDFALLRNIFTAIMGFSENVSANPHMDTS
jgi:hypothetical protein